METKKKEKMDPKKAYAAGAVVMANAVIKTAKEVGEIDFSPLGRQSPYRDFIRRLQEAGEGKVAVLNPKAKPSLSAQARKIGVKLEFAEKAGNLYVRVKVVPPMSPLGSFLLKNLTGKLKSAAELHKLATDDLNGDGIGGVTLDAVRAGLRQLQDQGLCKMDSRTGNWFAREGDTK